MGLFGFFKKHNEVIPQGKQHDISEKTRNQAPWFDVDELHEIAREQFLNGQIESEQQKRKDTLINDYKTNILSAFELYSSMVREFPNIAKAFGKEPLPVSLPTYIPAYTVPVYLMNRNPYLFANGKGDLLCWSGEGTLLKSFTSDDFKRYLDDWVLQCVKVNHDYEITVRGEAGLIYGLTMNAYIFQMINQTFDYMEYRIIQEKPKEEIIQSLKKGFISQARDLDLNR